VSGSWTSAARWPTRDSRCATACGAGVNLFRGNQYWFCLAVDPESKNPKVSLFGPDGQRLAVLSHGETGLAAAGVTAGATGQYFVQVETEGGPATDFCLLYLFK
jgi:hypothetical protein